MVILHVKKGDESQFLYETTVGSEVNKLIKELVEIYNKRLKIQRLCYEIEELAKYGVCLPPAMQGLTPEQVSELKLKDEWAEKNVVSEKYVNHPDPMGRRNGLAPTEKYVDILTRTTAEAQAKISKKMVEYNKCLTVTDVQDALDMLKGATVIAYPMDFPPYEIIKEELESEFLVNAQDCKESLEEAITDLWWAGKQMDLDKKLSDYIGKNEKSKLVVKLQKKGYGPPAREPVLTEEQKKELMLAQYRRQEELKKLEGAEDDSYLDSQWADNNQLKKNFLGMNKIRFK